MEILRVDLPTLSNEELNDLFVLFEALRKEIDPDEPLLPRELRIKLTRNHNPHYPNISWIMKENDKVIGYANIRLTGDEAPGYDRNKHIGRVEVIIHKDFRNKGFGDNMLKILLEESMNYSDLKNLFGWTSLDPGIEFCKKINGKLSSEGVENRLKVVDVDWILMDEWDEIGKNLVKNEGVRLRFFEDCPDDIIEEYVAMYQEILNQQPLGDYDGVIAVTPESHRKNEKRHKKNGTRRFTLVSIEEDNRISGMTEISYNPVRGHRGNQNLTGVKSEYRGRGLGKWLKAHMLKWFVNEYPNVMYISTGNDVTNKPMFSINDRMGFKKYQSGYSYKFDLEELKKTVLQ